MHVNRSKCKGCKKCVDACPNSAIRIIKNKAYILRIKCNDCSLCARMCPQNAIGVLPGNFKNIQKKWRKGANPLKPYVSYK